MCKRHSSGIAFRYVESSEFAQDGAVVDAHQLAFDENLSME